MTAQLLTDRDGDTWEVPTDMLRNVETGRLMTRSEVEDKFGPLTADVDD